MAPPLCISLVFCALFCLLSVESKSASVLDKVLLELDSLKGVASENSKLIKQLTDEREEDRLQIAKLTERLRQKSEQFDTFRNQYKRDVCDIKQKLSGRNRHTDINGNGQSSGLKSEGKHIQEFNKLLRDSVSNDSDGEATDVKATSTNQTQDIAPADVHATRTGKQPSHPEGISKRLLIDAPDSNPREDRIAFSTYVSVIPTNLGNEHTIPFDTAITNMGNAFDTVLHTFICPVDGMYYFHSALTSAFQGHMETEMVKDGVSMARMYAGASINEFAHGYDQGANAVVAACSEGEHVWVRVRGVAGTTLSHDQFTTFSGFLLFTL